MAMRVASSGAGPTARDKALWLGRKRIVARTVTIKVRYSDFVVD